MVLYKFVVATSAEPVGWYFYGHRPRVAARLMIRGCVATGLAVAFSCYLWAVVIVPAYA